MNTRLVLPLLLVTCLAAPVALPAAAQAPARTAEPAPAEAGDGRFDLLEFQIEGNTVLPVAAIERAVLPFLGHRRSLEEVRKAVEALERAYREAGYLTVLVDIPEQEVQDGVVRLTVIEGRVDRVRVTGARYWSPGWIRGRMPEVAPGNVPYFPAVQRELAELNRSPNRRITPVLRPGRTPGTVEFDLNVEDRLPLHGSLELNDRHGFGTTRTRLAGALRYENLWQREHALSLNFLTAPENTAEARVVSASYLWPLHGSNQMLSFYAVRARSAVAAIGALNVLGDADIWGARWILPLRGLPDFFHSLTLGADYKDFRETINLVGGDTLRTPIAYTHLSAVWSATALGAGGVTQVNAGVGFGPRRLFGNSDAEFLNRRFNARANYVYLRGDVQRQQRLPGGYSLIARADFQFADEPLISNEQFFIGGVDSVRGYFEFEQLGDRGLRGRLELRAPNRAAKDSMLSELVGLAFLDAGAVELVQPLPGQTRSFQMASAGAGFRARAGRSFVAALDFAVPLRDTNRTQAGDPRVHFRLAYEF